VTHHTACEDAAALLRLSLSDRSFAIEPITKQQFSKVRSAHPTDSSNKKILLAAGAAAMLRLQFAVEKFDRI
jgi:hypothetical protein